MKENQPKVAAESVLDQALGGDGPQPDMASLRIGSILNDPLHSIQTERIVDLVCDGRPFSGEPIPAREPRANDRQEGGEHYKKQAIQPWDYIISNELGFLEGNVIKYVTRHKDKNGVADIKKAIHYLEKLLETEVAKESAA